MKKLGVGSLFGEMPLLGQTMVVTRAITGQAGATVAVMDAEQARELIRANPVAVVEQLGPRLAAADVDYYRAQFQPLLSRMAALLLELAGEGSTVEGIRQEAIGEKIGSRREPIANRLLVMKTKKLIEVGRNRITILNREALQELSEW